MKRTFYFRRFSGLAGVVVVAQLIETYPRPTLFFTKAADKTNSDLFKGFDVAMHWEAYVGTFGTI
jgi:hypothetical protein